MHLLILDTETGGLDPSRHALLEVGALLVNDRLDEVGRFDVLVRPWSGLAIDPEALAVNCLRPVDLANGIPEDDAMRRLLEFVAGPLARGSVILVGWNVSFDQAFLQAAFQRHRLRWPFGHRSLDVQSVWAFCQRWDFSGLTNACNKLFGNAPEHRALADAAVTLEVLRRCAASWGQTRLAE